MSLPTTCCDSGINIDGGALGQALGWSVVAALGIAIEGVGRA
jgi:hypothetical protein